jgi:hypothetical protein
MNRKTAFLFFLCLFTMIHTYRGQAQLAGGTYTINSGAPTGGTNYISFTDAVAAMALGVTGPVVFNVAAGSGPYTEQFNIGNITGASSTNTIKFNGNGATVQFTPTTTYSGILMMNGTKYVKVDSLTFKSLSTTYGFGAILYNACDYDSITRCKFDLTTVTTTTAANCSGIRISTTASTTSSTVSGASNTYLGGNSVLGNTATGGPYYGFYFYGPNTNNVYQNNYVLNYYYYGFYDYYGANISYLGNTLSRETKTTLGGYYGLYLYYTTAGSKIVGNKIRNLGGPTPTATYCYPFNLMSSNGTAGAPILVSNNLIYNMTSVPYYGIRLSSSNFIDIYHNTVSVDPVIAYSNTTYGFYLSSANNCNVRNNNISITGGGTSTKYGLYYSSITGTASDYNNVYVNSTQTGTQAYGYLGAVHNTLTAFQAANPGYETNGLSVDPQFAAPGTGNFTPGNIALIGVGTNLQASVTVDINNGPRAVNPTLGAFEGVTTPCTGRPDAGTVTAAPAPPCPNQSFTLRRVGGTTTVTSNITYQWQDSTSTGWQNSTGATATGNSHTTSVTATTKFRVILTCANGNLSDTSATYTVVPAPFIDCYCKPTYTGAAANIITNVTLGTLNNTSSGAAPYYTDYTPQQPATLPIPTLTMGNADTVSITMGTYATNFSAIWVDFNHSGSFEPNEYFTLPVSVGANGIAKVPVLTPLTAMPGLTRMRIRSGDRSAVGAAMPCNNTSSGYGEAEDYLVNIVYPPCSGPLNAGAALSDANATCKGYLVNVWNFTHDYNYSLIGWSWQKSPDGGNSWNDIPNSANKDTLNNILITGAASFRLKMLCDATGDSSFSVPVHITIKAPYECYCYSQSDGGTNDISDIGAVVIGTMINSTGGPHILNPQAIRRRTDFTDIANITMSANGRYKLSIYHTQRNDTHQDARVSVFIDFNNDLQYDVNAPLASELVFSGITRANNFYIDTAIYIPAAVIPNVPTGMRIILNNDLNPLSPANLGCGPYVSGETEDYVVRFTRAPQSVGGVNGILENVSIYPNPSQGMFTVDVSAAKAMDKLDVTVTNISGQQVMLQHYEAVGNQFTRTFNLNELARGMYFLEVRTATGEKLVKKLVLR